MKRTEASIEEWGDLYRLGTFLWEMEPWRDLWDTDLISLTRPGQAEPVYCSIMGKAGQTVGIAFYEGRKGLEEYSLMLEHERFGVPPAYATFRMNSLTIYWGDRSEVSPQQYKIIKELGYKYRGHNSWMYFIAQKNGFFPFLPNREEVLRLTDYAEALIGALEYQKTWQLPVDYDGGEVFQFNWAPATKDRTGAAALPDRGFFMEGIQLEEATRRQLMEQKATTQILEVDMVYLMAGVEDPDQDRPLCPRIALMADHKAGLILFAEVIPWGEDPEESLVNTLTDWILRHGRPRRILVRNRLVEALISDLCSACKTKLVWQTDLPVLEEIVEKLLEFQP